MDEHNISTQVSLHSAGDIVFTIKDAITWLSSNYFWFVAIAAIIGGGKFLSIELPGLPKIIKDFISIKSEKDLIDAEITEKKLENYNKAIKLKKEMLNSGITISDLENLEKPLELLSTYSSSMQIIPINTIEETDINSISNDFETDNEEEST